MKSAEARLTAQMQLLRDFVRRRIAQASAAELQALVALLQRWEQNL